MKRDEWFPFNVGHYLRDTATLTTEQHGAYLLLILAYWPKGPLPDSDDALAAVARLSLPNWRRMRPVLEGFFTIKDGRWNHKRIDQERMKAFALTEVRKASGAEGAAKRYGKPIANAKPMLSQTARHSTITNTNNSSPIQTVSEGACVEDARPRQPDEALKVGSFMSGIMAQTLAQAAGKKKF